MPTRPSAIGRPAASPKQTTTEPVAPIGDFSLVQVAPHVYELRLSRPERTETPTQNAAPKRELQRRYKLEVTNGNGIPGMARRVARQLHSHGALIARTTNERPFTRQ